MFPDFLFLAHEPQRLTPFFFLSPTFPLPAAYLFQKKRQRLCRHIKLFLFSTQHTGLYPRTCK